ncbi:hypothetical protein D3C78_1319680 [compost metagenome]
MMPGRTQSLGTCGQPSTAGELRRLTSASRPARACSKTATCSTLAGQSGSSARAKWLISTIFSTLPLADRRCQASRYSAGCRPTRCIPESSLSQTVSGLVMLACSMAASCQPEWTTVQKSWAWISSSSAGSKKPSSSRIGLAMPAARSSSASSMQATAKPLASDSRAWAQRTAPWP